MMMSKPSSAMSARPPMPPQYRVSQKLMATDSVAYWLLPVPRRLSSHATILSIPLSARILFTMTAHQLAM